MAEQALFAGDSRAFEAMVQQMLSAQNEVRDGAEKVFSRVKDQADLCISNLLRLLRTHQDQSIRSFSAVLLRRLLAKEDPSLWTKCSPDIQNATKEELLKCIRDEQDRPTVRKVCDTVAEFAMTIFEAPGWPELLPFLFHCAQSRDARLVEGSLLMFAQLAPQLAPVLRQYLATLHEVLLACLSHSDSTVRLASMRAATNFIQELDEADRSKFQDLLPPMLSAMGAVLNDGDETAAQDALELFVEMADTNPKFMRKHGSDIISAMLQIMEAATLEEGTRVLAAEFLVTLCESRDKVLKKQPQLGQPFFSALLKFLLDVEDEPDWYNGDNDKHEAEEEGELFEFGEECLDRLALALGGAGLLPLAQAALPQLLQSPDWKQRHAALICLAQTAEGCVKSMLRQVAPWVDICLMGLRDQHPRVRWAACQALGQMCTDLGPDIQGEQHQQILPALMAVMEDFAQPRVQAHSAAAIVNFSENCDQEILPPYLDDLITHLLRLLQNGKRIVQEGALTAMASVADCAKAHFIRYYDSVMPLLSQLLMGATDNANKLLWAKSLECISLVGMAVGRDRFRTEAHNVMRCMQQLQESHLDADDPRANYMLQAGARLCKCLGNEFIPYLGVVMPSLLRSAQLKPDVNVADAGSDEEDDDDDEVETVYLGDRKISIRTSILEEKATACNMLCCYADELKEGFLPYVEQVAGVMVPLLKFYFHEEVRSAAAQSLPELLRSAVLASEKGQAQSSSVKQLLDGLWQPLIDAIQKEPELLVLSTMLEALEEVIDQGCAPGLIGQQHLGQVCERLQAVLTASLHRRSERDARQQRDDYDEEEAEALEDEDEEDVEVLEHVSGVITETRVCICIIDDILEHSPAGSQKYMQQALPSCSRLAPTLMQICGNAQAPHSKSEDNRNATENAVSALGKDHRASEQTLAKNLNVLFFVCSKGTDLAEPQTITAMVALLQRLQSSLPADAFNGLLSQLQPNDLATIQRLMAKSNGTHSPS
ncbi:hypothetical protein WJX84_012004 [Apatococcus fuscideae]|uniref:Uncharacterized protein n=1 Tax=Apatococcus fuscideae TaxID=2026836 RepID=A0AAW1SXS6_9CHLO